MPHVSQHSLDPKVQRELIETLELVLTKLTKKEPMKEFLFALLTPTEQLMLAKRLAMTILLKEGVPETQVAQALHVTRGTVARMQLFLEARGQGYDAAFQVLESEKLMQELKTMLLNLAKYSIRAAGGRI